MSTCIYQMQCSNPVMVFRLAAGAVAEAVVPLGLAKAGFLLAALLYWASLLRPRSVVQLTHSDIHVYCGTRRPKQNFFLKKTSSKHPRISQASPSIAWQWDTA